MPLLPDGRFRPDLASTAWLAAIGITQIGQVAERGVIPVCVALRAAGFPVSLNMAYGLAGDLLGLPWNHLPPDLRAQLQRDWAAARVAGSQPGRARP
jgi:hypothetical protein